MTPSSMQDKNDHELILELVKNNDKALSQLYDRHAPFLYAFALHVANDKEVVDQMIVEAFWQAWQHADGFEEHALTTQQWLGRFIQAQTVQPYNKQKRINDDTEFY